MTVVNETAPTLTCPIKDKRAFWKRLGIAALLFYCIKGGVWLAIGWYALR